MVADSNSNLFGAGGLDQFAARQHRYYTQLMPGRKYKRYTSFEKQAKGLGLGWVKCVPGTVGDDDVTTQIWDDGP